MNEVENVDIVQLQPGDVVSFEISGIFKRGEVVSVNENTVRVKLKDGGIVKRHVNKHFVTKVE